MSSRGRRLSIFVARRRRRTVHSPRAGRGHFHHPELQIDGRKVGERYALFSQTRIAGLYASRQSKPVGALRSHELAFSGFTIVCRIIRAYLVPLRKRAAVSAIPPPQQISPSGIGPFGRHHQIPSNQNERGDVAGLHPFTLYSLSVAHENNCPQRLYFSRTCHVQTHRRSGSERADSQCRAQRERPGQGRSIMLAVRATLWEITRRTVGDICDIRGVIWLRRIRPAYADTPC
jgi:hypothetical protein